jgi:hypothetical protein
MKIITLAFLIGAYQAHADEPFDPSSRMESLPKSLRPSTYVESLVPERDALPLNGYIVTVDSYQMLNENQFPGLRPKPGILEIKIK